MNARASLHQHFANKDWFGWLAQRLGFRPDESVLDIGCGPGWFWTEIEKSQQLPDNFMLLDKSHAMVAEVKEKFGERVKAQVGRAEALPFADETFDSLVAMHVLYHVPDPTKALKEAQRVLKPGGSLFVTTNSKRNLLELGEISSAALGGSSVDLGAQVFDVEKAEQLAVDVFGNRSVELFTDTYRCTNAEIVAASLLSSPRGLKASTNQKEKLLRLLKKEIEKGRGAIMAHRESGLITATKTKA